MQHAELARLLRLIGIVTPIAACFCACEANNLYVAHDTVLGVNAQVNPSRQQGRLVIGYDRDFATIIPQAVAIKDPSRAGEEDVMALLGCTELEVDGLFLTKYSDSLASGGAAIEFAKKVGTNAGQGRAFFACHEDTKK